MIGYQLEFAALPPDVRRVSDLPTGELIFPRGCAPDGRRHRLSCNHTGHSPDKSLVALTEGRRPSAHRMAEP